MKPNETFLSQMNEIGELSDFERLKSLRLIMESSRSSFLSLIWPSARRQHGPAEPTWADAAGHGQEPEAEAAAGGDAQPENASQVVNSTCRQLMNV
jgi:hypothetical protein